MRILVWPLTIAVALMLGAATLLGLAIVFAGSSARAADPERLPSGLGQVRVVAEQNGGFHLITSRTPQIRARRIISDPGLNSPLVLTFDGRKLMVSGHVTCAKGDDYEIQTTATQSTTGALARGRTEGRCSGQREQFEAPTWVYDEALFEPGPAQVCGLLITRARGKVSDVFQWCRKESADLQSASAVYY